MADQTDRTSTAASESHAQPTFTPTFTLASAIGKTAGSGMLKGASPIPRITQATTALIQFTDAHTPDPSGALKSLLRRRIQASTDQLAKHLDTPLRALPEILAPMMTHPHALHEFVRQVDMRWGEMYQERPHFQQPGQTPHPEDEYTHTSVKHALEHLLDQAAQQTHTP
jgi:hypothetical protein